MSVSEWRLFAPTLGPKGWFSCNSLPLGWDCGC